MKALFFALLTLSAIAPALAQQIEDLEMSCQMRHPCDRNNTCVTDLIITTKQNVGTAALVLQSKNEESQLIARTFSRIIGSTRNNFLLDQNKFGDTSEMFVTLNKLNARWSGTVQGIPGYLGFGEFLNCEQHQTPQK